MFCPKCHRRAPAGTPRCLYDNTALQADPRIGLHMGALQLAEFCEQQTLGPVYRLRGSDELLQVFEGECIDPGADFDLYVAEIERLHEVDAPQIHRISAAGEAAGLRFCVQRPPDGIPLSWVLDEAEGQVSLGTVVFILEEIANALAVAHRRGVAHGGLSPDSIRLLGGIEAYGVVVEGFATVRLRVVGDAPHPIPEYAAPGARPHAPAPADDLYAFGVIAFELLAGQHPYRRSQFSRYNIPALDEIVDGMPKPLCALVAGLLDLRASQRPTAAHAATLLSGLDLPEMLLTFVPDPGTTGERLERFGRRLASGAESRERSAVESVSATAPTPERGRWLPWVLVLLGVAFSIGAWAVLRSTPEPSPSQASDARRVGPALTPGARRVQVGPEYPTLTAAIAAAQPHDQIGVPAGVYVEQVRVRIPLTIVAEPGATLEAPEDTALDLSADAHLIGLTIRGRGARNRYAVRISAGQVRFEDVTVYGAGGSAIGITERGEAILTRSRVHGGAASGVLALQDAQLSLVDAEVTGARLSGIELAGRATASIRKSSLSSNAGAGLLARDDATVFIGDSELALNGNAGVVIKDRAEAQIMGAKVRNNRASGLFLRSTGETRVSRADVFGNDFAGVEIRDGARPVVQRCVVRDGRAGGILVHADARPVLEDNAVLGNAGVGIEIADRGDPVVRRNRIEGGRAGGIIVHQGGRGRVVSNRLVGQQGVGIHVRGTAPAIESNIIDNGGAAGILIEGRATPRVIGNTVRGHRTHGVHVRGARPIVRDNHIERSAAVGIFIDAAGGQYAGNQLIDNGEAWRIVAPFVDLVREEAPAAAGSNAATPNK